MMMKPTRLAAVLALLVVGASDAAAGHRAPGPPEADQAAEIAPGSPQVCVGTHSLEADALAELEALGVDCLRHTLYPPLWDDPAYRRRFPALVNAAADRFRILLVVHPLPDGWGPSDFADWIGDRAHQMPGVDAWQIGNEAPFRDHQAVHAAAFRAIKSADPDALVVTLAMPDEGFARAWSAPADALSVHIYGFPLGPRVHQLREWLPPDRPVWITEFGIERKVIGPRDDWEQVQAQQWQEAIEACSAAGFSRCYGYQLRTDEPGETHGIIEARTGRWRPVARWLEEWLGRGD